MAVRWLDSGLHVDRGWASAGEHRSGDELKRMEVITVGIVMDEDDDTLAVALNHDPAHDTWLAVQFIAKENIIYANELTPA